MIFDFPELILYPLVFLVLYGIYWLRQKYEEKQRNRSVYEILGNEKGLKRIVNEFYTNIDTLPEASEIKGWFKDDPIHRREKLFEYMSSVTGGPDLYFERTGTLCLTKTHKKYNITVDIAKIWLKCMKKSLIDNGVPEETIDKVKTIIFPLAKDLTVESGCSVQDSDQDENLECPSSLLRKRKQ
mmetsp:Transcript_10001/g.11365  ORF Transcript_10001/g.11365 Transcript_10001/m.11365 type:complete len:184 (+) Transcript_10001:202-753(+)|eukprot:CAMPEP_0204835418 /NCGR_PEP_ID=MMETSP1346-20131115/22584_1 /ASSEMBLY_ACC=CAM_ASM_000771 /TAXON_ID=215587 /ORGANISM="Aplanochytrium stocchinoi, Strain GSBS06" /LENGTH=183 /DNA_ID=CAMNT_0051969427 /DNA_START=258 /DNA_END=809 /DNA_ORIENTATION=-